MDASASRYKIRFTKIVKSWWITTLSQLGLKILFRVKSSKSKTQEISSMLKDTIDDEQSRNPTGFQNMEVSDSNSQAFTFFPSLPVELQLAIWDFAAFVEPRIIHVVIHKKPPSTYARTLLPSIFAVCHNSRKTAYQHYNIKWEPPSMMWLQSGTCYNPTIDTFLFSSLSHRSITERGDDNFLLFYRTSGLEGIKHLAVAYKANSAAPVFPGNFANLDTSHLIYFHKMLFPHASLPLNSRLRSRIGPMGAFDHSLHGFNP